MEPKIESSIAEPSSAGENVNPRRARILVVDASAADRACLRDVLQNAHLGRVDEAADWRDVLVGLGRNPIYDLVLLETRDDSGDDSAEAVRFLKSDPRREDLPILMVSPRPEGEALAGALDAGAMDFVIKPIQPIFFLARVRAALRLKSEIDERRHREKQVFELTQQLEEANENLLQLAEIDVLTELANRRKFDLALGEEWRRCQRQQRPLALVLLDVDHFESYNDRSGRHRGDVCLQRIAVVISRAARRSGDLACRWDAKTFAIILPGVDEHQGPVMAEYLREQVERLKIEHPQHGYLTVSLGVASAVPCPEHDAQALVSVCRSALRRAKDAGRNRVESAPLRSREMATAAYIPTDSHSGGV